MIFYALKRFIFLTGLIILMQNKVDKPTVRGISICRFLFGLSTFCRFTLVYESAYEVKNNLRLFERPFKIQNNCGFLCFLLRKLDQ